MLYEGNEYSNIYGYAYGTGINTYILAHSLTVMANGESPSIIGACACYEELCRGPCSSRNRPMEHGLRTTTHLQYRVTLRVLYDVNNIFIPII